MRALAILVKEGDFDHGSLCDFYRPVQRRQPNEELDTLAFECILMSMHNVASLNAFQESDDSYSFVRSAIVSWYYTIYYASKSMIAAATGSDPQSHTKTGRIWQTDIAPRGLVVSPFDYNFTDFTPVPSILESRSQQRLGGVPVHFKRYLKSARCSDNPMHVPVTLHLYEVELEREPELNPDYYVDSGWFSVDEYLKASADAPIPVWVWLTRNEVITPVVAALVV